MLATVWLDVLFAPLLALGLESIEAAAGTDGGYGNSIIHADYTHSLAGAAIIAAVTGFAAARFWGERVGLVLGAVVFSHWLLDLVVHRADMPVFPGAIGDLPRLGLGLWTIPAASIAVELALVVAGALLYWGAARRTAVEAGGDATTRADVLGGLMALAGVVTLSVDAALG